MKNNIVSQRRNLMLIFPPFFKILKIKVNRIVHSSCILYVCSFAFVKESELQA
jgi:hypothetical protein